MTEAELKQFAKVPVEALLMDSMLVIRGTVEEVSQGYVKFSSVEELFSLPHGKRLSMKLMLAGTFADLEDLLSKLSFPCSIFDKCKKLGT